MIGEGITVAVDPGSGAACATTPEILTRLGCRVVTINSQMDGRFPGRLPEPSPEGLLGLGDLVRATGAALGIAHDGDADRAVFLDEQGQFIEENQEFALIADQVCGERKGIVVMPVSTSRVVETIARNNGCDVRYTPVGSIYVARAMRALEAEGSHVAFGRRGQRRPHLPGPPVLPRRGNDCCDDDRNPCRESAARFQIWLPHCRNST